MTIEEKRKNIAKACGWSVCPDGITWMAPGSRLKSEQEGGGIKGYWCVAELLPDYFNDLNAMHTAEKVLKGSKDDEHSEISEYQGQLILICACSQDPVDVYEVDLIRSTAAQRAEAFGIALGLWKEGE